MSKSRSLSIYKALLRESQKFTLYNYRMYAIRKIRDEFRQNKSVQDQAKLTALLKKAEESLQIIRRQVTLGILYKDKLSVIEAPPAKLSKQLKPDNKG